MTEKGKEVGADQREKDLDKSFVAILNDTCSGKRLKEVRKKAVVYGFTEAYQQKHYENILTVAKRPNKIIIENNSEINEFIEIARLKTT